MTDLKPRFPENEDENRSGLPGQPGSSSVSNEANAISCSGLNPEPYTADHNIYVHVPFCRHLCCYCAFEKSLNLKKIPMWLDRIVSEASLYCESQRIQNPQWQIETLYFGGGTPSVLSQRQLEQLATPFLPDLCQDGYEWTIEVNPETVSSEDLMFYKQLGINRLSIGIQSFDDGLLDSIGRKHTGRQAQEIFLQARAAGFENISADLIFALPSQSFEQLQNDVEQMIALAPDHISIYSLQIEENSVFGKQNLQPVDEDLEASEFEWLIERLKQAGYEHYEISSFALDRHYSRHNLSVWMGKEYAGIGHGACGRDSKGFCHHEGSLAFYIKEGSRIDYDDSGFAFVDLMLGFRTQFGVCPEDWNKKYARICGRDLHQILSPLLIKYPGIFETFSVQGKERISLNEQGREILNTVLSDLLDLFEPDE